MKIAYKHISNRIKSKPSIDDISSKLFQLGHEHEINDGVFDIEITPNRGDCLSVQGILRDLAVYYDVSFFNDIYEDEIDELSVPKVIANSEHVFHQYTLRVLNGKRDNFNLEYGHVIPSLIHKCYF